MDIEICACCGKPKKPKIGTKKQTGAKFKLTQETIDNGGFNDPDRAEYDVTAPATELAAAWQGHRYGLQAMKPAFEFICVAQKPYQGSPVECITRTGAGALWIDGGRIGTEQLNNGPATPRPGTFNESYHADYSGQSVIGRWPANLLLCHDPCCEPIGTRRVRGGSGWSQSGSKASTNIAMSGPNYDRPAHPDSFADADGMETITAWRCVESCPVRRLGEQSGESESKAGMRGLQVSGAHGGLAQGTGQIKEGTNSQRGHDDSGTAARYFFQASYMYERLEAADPLFYCAKADRAEREAGLDPRQIALLGMEEIDAGSRPDGSMFGFEGRSFRDGQWVNVKYPESTINDGRQKSIDNPYQRGETARRNIHPTIKPLSLCRYLATLLLPPALYAPRRLLVPFCGAASEYIGGILAGWEEIVGIEIEADYCRIGEARAAYWRQRRHEFLDPSKPIEAKVSAAPTGQRDMFLEDL